MRSAPIVVALAVLLAGCEDLVTVQVALGSIEIRRDLSIGEVPPDVCPRVTRELEPDRALSGSATLAPVATRCVLTIRLEDAVLMEREQVLSIREELEGADTTALLGVVVEVRALELTDAWGAPIDPSRLEEIEARVDGVPIVPATAIDAPVDSMRVVLPESTVDELLAAIDEGREVRADLELRLAFSDPAAIPSWLHLRLVLAPSLLVDAVRAAL